MNYVSMMIHLCARGRIAPITRLFAAACFCPTSLPFSFTGRIIESDSSGSLKPIRFRHRFEFILPDNRGIDNATRELDAAYRMN